jgi:hypothetical protein
VYVTFDAITLLERPPSRDDVDVRVMYGFASANLAVDVFCVVLLLRRGGRVCEAREVRGAAARSLQRVDSAFLGGDDDDLDEDGCAKSEFGIQLPGSSRSSSSSSNSNSSSSTGAEEDDEADESCGLVRPPPREARKNLNM